MRRWGVICLCLYSICVSTNRGLDEFCRNTLIRVLLFPFSTSDDTPFETPILHIVYARR